MEVVTFVDLASFEFLAEDFFGELVWAEQGEIAAKWEQEDSVNAGGFHEAEFLRRGREQLEAGVGAQNPNGVWVEGDSDRFRVPLPGTLNDVAEDGLMGAMDAVEIADTDDGGAEAGGYLVEVAKEEHAVRMRVARNESRAPGESLKKDF
jgi:hypothetical protein